MVVEIAEVEEGATVFVVGGRVTVVLVVGATMVLRVVYDEVIMTVPPGLVAVFSDGKVISCVTGTDVCNVIGTKTVAFVVGGSSVEVIVYVLVASKVEVS